MFFDRHSSDGVPYRDPFLCGTHLATWWVCRRGYHFRKLIRQVHTDFLSCRVSANPSRPEVEQVFGTTMRSLTSGIQTSLGIYKINNGKSLWKNWFFSEQRSAFTKINYLDPEKEDFSCMELLNWKKNPAEVRNIGPSTVDSLLSVAEPSRLLSHHWKKLYVKKRLAFFQLHRGHPEEHRQSSLQKGL